MQQEATSDHDTSKRRLSLKRNFYQQFLKQHEGRKQACWTFQMIARRKYYPELPRGNVQLLRELLRAETMTETRFLNLLDLLEYKAKLYNMTGEGMPPKACVCYMSANALDEKKAYFMHYENMLQQVKDMAVNGSDEMGVADVSSVMTDYKSCLEKSPFREYVKLDVDTKDYTFLKELMSVLKENDIDTEYTVETHGGYHVLIGCGTDLTHLYELQKKVVAEFGKKDAWFTIEPPKKSPRLAVPGMYQSNFLPELREVGIKLHQN